MHLSPNAPAGGGPRRLSGDCAAHNNLQKCAVPGGAGQFEKRKPAQTPVIGGGDI